MYNFEKCYIFTKKLLFQSFYFKMSCLIEYITLIEIY